MVVRIKKTAVVTPNKQIRRANSSLKIKKFATTVISDNTNNDANSVNIANCIALCKNKNLLFIHLTNNFNVMSYDLFLCNDNTFTPIIQHSCLRILKKINPLTLVVFFEHHSILYHVIA